MSHSEVQESESGKQLLQVCKWGFSVFSGTFEALLAVTEQPQQRSLSFKLIRSGFMKDFEGHWAVTPAASGSALPPLPAPAAGAAPTGKSGSNDAAAPGTGDGLGRSAAAARGNGDGDNDDDGEEWCLVTHQLIVRPLVDLPPPLPYYARSIFVSQVTQVSVL